MIETKKKYQIIYADPCWEFGTWGKTGKRAPQNHYNCEPTEWICQLPIKELVDENCILFLWTTYPALEQSFKVIEAWGFKYSTVGFTWAKLNKTGKGYFMGLGYWTRANPEICLIATKGNPKRICKSVCNLCVSKLREHSRKPDEIRDRIVKLCGDLPRIELFARQRFEGWDVWGNEAPTEVQKMLNAELNCEEVLK